MAGQRQRRGRAGGRRRDRDPDDRRPASGDGGLLTASVDDVREIARPLPRSYEVVVRDRVKFRIGKIVYLAFSRDETVLGFAFPREERSALLAARPAVFLPPDRSDERFNWLR